MAVKNNKRIILFGGNRALFNFAKNAKGRGVETVIFTNAFRLGMPINKYGTLRQNLKKEGISYIEKDSLSRDLIAKYVDKNTVGLSISTFWVFKKNIIKLFKGRLYNYHGAKLPEERGSGTFTWKILSQMREGGLTIHRIEPAIDAGDIIMQRRFIFPKLCRIPIDYINYTEKKETEILLEFLEAVIQEKEFKPVPQMANHSFYWPVLNTSLNGFIDWSWKAFDLELFINAFDDPYQGASTFYEGKRVYLKKCFKSRDKKIFHPFQAGIVFRKYKGLLFIAARGGRLMVKDVFNKKGDNIANKIKLGRRFYTPCSVLGMAKTTKAKYGPRGLRQK